MGQHHSVEGVNSSQDPNDPQPHKQQKQHSNQIVVVSTKIQDKSNELSNDEDIQLLHRTKHSRPILKNGESEYVKLPRIISGPLTEMILRYQFHLTECAEAVAFDQNALTKQMKETDSIASKAFKIMNDRFKNTEKALNQLQTVYEVTAILNQIETNLNACIKLFKTLNKKLPMEEQIYDPEFR